MKLDKEALSKIYCSLPDDQIESYISNHIKNFTYDALEVLKNEVEIRGLSPRLKEQIELQLTKGLQPSHREILLKLWLYPLITLLIVFICVCFKRYTGRLTADVSSLLIIIIPFLGIAGIINLVKGLRLFIITKNRKVRRMTKKIVTGLVLNVAVIAIPIGSYIDSYMYRKEIERHNEAVGQIHILKMNLLCFCIDHGAYPSESKGLSTLRKFDRHSPTVDPWGRPYGYRLIKSPGTSENFEPYVWSYGPDGISGTIDDIDENSHRHHLHYYHWPAA